MPEVYRIADTVDAKVDPRRRADHVMIGTTDSLCPLCMDVVPAKIIVRRGRVYFRKRCPVHGVREDFVCSDARWWDRNEGQTSAVLPRVRSTRHRKGCPKDCGLCEDHEQHTCIGLVELTDGCNLTCPMCYAGSGPGGKHHPVEDILRSLDRLVECEGRAEVCQLSGGEPTLHPEFRRVVDAALSRPIDYVMINTNGIRLAGDADLVEFLGERRQRVEIYFQWDGDDEATVRRIRGEDVVEVKRRALDRLAKADLNVTLVSTLAAPLPDDFYARLWAEALSRPNVVGLSLQPATYSGRNVTPDDLEHRVTFPDVIDGLAGSSSGVVRADHFAPLPCAHPNCHQILLAARHGNVIEPIAGGETLTSNLDLIAGGISFTPHKAKRMIDLFLARASHCGPDCGCHTGSASDVVESSSAGPVASRFFERVISETATARDLFRVTITSFLDAYNFDVRQVMKCCTHHVLPSGHVVPFCAYNTLYREGHLALPPVESQ